MNTEDQTLHNQRADVKRVLRVRRFRQAASFEEHVSAAKARPEFDTMMDAAHCGEFDVIVVWALDRFGRSMVGNLQAVLDLDSCGVEIISVNESWLDTGGPVRPLQIAIFGWVAEQERVRLGERTKAGLKRVRHQGGVIGRPRRIVCQECQEMCSPAEVAPPWTFQTLTEILGITEFSCHTRARSHHIKIRPEDPHLPFSVELIDAGPV